MALQRPPQSDHSSKKLLVREVIRQAFLLTAREEFGAATRDEILHEPTEDIGFEARVFDLAIDVMDSGAVKFELRAARNGGAVVPWRAEFQATGEELLLTAITNADGWSQHAFKKFLKEAGLQEASVPTSAAKGLPEDSVSLELVSLTAQMRRVHAALQQDPRSVTLLAALAGHYALLGSLCEPHWSCEHKVFKARALLYAERAVRFGPQDAGAAWTRALVRTIVGLNSQALTEITRARELVDGQVEPAWAPVVVAAAHWDNAALEKLVSEELPLAAYLSMLNQELVGSDDRRAAAYQSMLQSDPLCFRASLAASNASALGLRRQYGERQLHLFAQQLPDLLKAFEPIQPDLKQTLRTLRSRPAAARDPLRSSRDLVAALRAVRSDAGEPSLAVTAHLIDELQFMQAVRLTHTNRFYLGVGVADLIKSFRKLFATADLKEFFQLYDRDTLKAQGEYQKLAWAIQRSEPSQSAFETLDEFAWLRISSQDYVVGAARGARDDVVPDLLAKLTDKLPDAELAGALAVLQRLAPECPAVNAATITRDWAAAEPRAAEWEQKTSSPAVLIALAGQYFKQKNVAAEERCLLRLKAVDPSHSSYSVLAEFYRRHERDEQWKSVVIDSLALPSHGLEDSNANWELAQWHIRRNEWQAARPFALASAEAYSSRGLHVAADCLEALEEWDESEQYIRASSQRYGGDWLSWYLWCRRTGRGDRDAACKLAKSAVAAAADNDRPKSDVKLDLAILYQLEGDLRGALKLQRELYHETEDDYHAMMAILLLDELQEYAERDLLIRNVCAFARQTSVGLLCEQLRQAAGNAGLSPAEMELSAAFQLDKGEPTNSAYFAGKILRLRGREDEAVVWLKRAASSPFRFKRTCTLAAAELIKSGTAMSAVRGTDIDEAHLPAVKLIRQAQAARETDTLIAESFFHQAIELDPKWPITLLLGAAGSAGCGHLDQSLQLYSKLVDLVPGQPLVLCSRAKIREALHDNRGAIADYEAALASSPSYRIAHNNLGWLRAAAPEADLRNAEQALGHARRSIEVSVTQDADWLVLWAAAYAEQGNFDEAVRLIEAAIAKGTYGNRGQLEAWLKSYQQQQPYHRKPDSPSPGSLFSNG